jgi:hypothetical protein
MDSKNVLSIWLVVGISLLVNGALILGAGLYELVRPPEVKVVLYEYHASIWWGAILFILGAIYTIRFAPGRRRRELAAEAAAAATTETQAG